MEQEIGFVGKWDYSPVMFWTEKCTTCSVYSLLLTVICILTFRPIKVAFKSSKVVLYFQYLCMQN